MTSETSKTGKPKTHQAGPKPQGTERPKTVRGHRRTLSTSAFTFDGSQNPFEHSKSNKTLSQRKAEPKTGH